MGNLRLPAVGKILTLPQAAELIDEYGREAVSSEIKRIIGIFRDEALKSEGGETITAEQVLDRARKVVVQRFKPSLKPVINGTGIVIHTNLGRAPMGEEVGQKLLEMSRGYNNLEFDLDKGKRGSRQSHVKTMLKRITGAEDVIIVNNNAAALILLLKCFAYEKEVIVSRGELIEIGGSFRIPEIMESSGAILKDVGATNKTKPSDFEKAMNDKTAMFFKAHQSNFKIVGFTEEVDIDGLAALGKKHNIMSVYDLGSGMLRRPKGINTEGEPTVEESIKAGIDLVTFSGDKLLGGPQAGLIAGKRELIQKLSREPIMRALRPGKLTLVALQVAISHYFNDKKLFKQNPVFSLLAYSEEDLHLKAKKMEEICKAKNISCSIKSSDGQVGGGALPALKLAGYAIAIHRPENSKLNVDKFSEKLFTSLLNLELPILGILREGEFLLDVRTLFESDLEQVAESVQTCIQAL